MEEEKSPKNQIVGIGNSKWKLTSRRTTLKEINSTEIHIDVNSIDTFEKYYRQYARKQHEVLDIDQSLKETQNESSSVKILLMKVARQIFERPD